MKTNKDDPNYCEPAFGIKQQRMQREAASKIELYEKKYANMKSFISEEAKALRYEINRLQATLR